jgi:hypothetical protein
MRKHQSLIPNDKALAVTNSKQCRMSKLPDVSLYYIKFLILQISSFSLLQKLIDIQNMPWIN